ncbi:S8 family serine peptidase [Paractinoplanes atraurantiacus]|uniref:Serine protease, subtilisin family n=1 Tax=Paractinoplanes atraurantiacus TaxID=1036182 RepID=A0A285K905_9ACTN|nr:S8 family serine peptidase [Actinoplanes atraurantiacus]SNY69070.1 Serine protease, subtilisin family [Actinoplanes atraurantiacus]
MKTAAAAALATASLTAVTAAPALAAPAGPTPSSLVVGLRSDSAAASTVSALDADPDVSVLSSTARPSLDAVTVTVPAGDSADAIAALRADPNVTYVEPKVQTSIVSTAAPNDTYYAQQWGLGKIKAPAAWARTTGGGVVVAVVDTGVTTTNELSGRVLAGYDFVNNDADPSDDNGHGTRSASVIAAKGDNGAGLAGVCWDCKILPVKVMGSDGTGSSDVVAQGIVYAVDHGAAVINLSLGSDTETQVLADAVKYATDHNVVVVASAGNDGVTSRFYPAAYTEAIAVAGSDAADGRYSWSNYNSADDPWVDLTAPGANYAQGPTFAYGWFVGTSSAGPVVAGVAALARAAKPAATAAQIRAALESQADPVGSWVAKGRVDAEGTLQKLVTGASAAPSTSFSITTPAAGTIPVALNDPSDDTIKMEVLVADKAVASTEESPWSIDWDTTGLNGTKAVKVRVTDSAGNVATSAARSISFDNTGPALKWTAPVATAALRGTTTITATATDSSGVATVELLADDELIAEDLTSPYAVTVDTTTLNASQALTLRAVDKLGNITDIARTVTVDNEAPTVDLTLPDALRGSVKLTPDVADNVAVKLVKAVITDSTGKAVTTLSATKAPWTLAWNTGKLSGEYEIAVTATDTTGNSTTGTFTANVDNAAPSAAATVPAMIAGPVTVELSAPSDDTAKMELLVNNRVTETVESAPWSIEWTPAAAGSYTLVVRTTDAAGNVASTTRKVTVDTAGPRITWSAPAATTLLRGTATVTTAVTDPAGVAKVELLADGEVVGEDTTAPYAIAVDTTSLAASQELELRATDKLGNVATLTRTYTVDNEAPTADLTLAGPLSGTAKLTPEIADNVGVKQVKAVVTDSTGKTITTVTSTRSPWTISWSTGKLRGEYTITLTVTDKAGNTGTWTGTAEVTNG